MMQEAYSISSLLTILVALFLGGMIFIKGRGGRVVNSYFLLMTFVALWAAGLFNTVVASSARYAFLSAKIFFISAAFIPSLYFRFIMRILGGERRYRISLWIGWITSACFVVLTTTPVMLEEMNFQFGVYWPKVGKLFWLYILYYVWYPLYAHFIAIANRDKLTLLAKKQLRYVSIAAIFGFGGGASTFLPMYGVFLPRLESVTIFFIPFACAFIAIATYTARLLDVEILRRRAVIFSLLYSVTVGVFISFVFIIQNIIQVKFDINRFIFPVSALFVITIFIRPLEHLLIRWTDKFLYQKRYNYQKILEDAGKGMLFITDTSKLFKLITRIVSKHMRITNAAIFLYDKDTGTYKCKATRPKSTDTQAEVKSTNTLIEWLKEKKAPLLMDDITNWLQKETIFPHKLILKRTLDQLRVVMNSLKASMCVPAFIKAELVGFLILGDKLSGAGYTKDDVSLLSTLSNSAAVAIENANMYEELRNRIARIAELYKEQHELFIDTATAFSYAVDLRDTYSRQHTQRIIEYCMIIIKGLDKMNAGYSREPDFIESLKIAALLHDVGKVGIPDVILNKEGPLTPEERQTIRNHINIAASILEPIKELGDVSKIVKYHHEFYDGNGYPEGRKGADIPFASRILSVANAYDAMTSDRPYRKALTHQKAAERLKQGAGKDFDPLIVEALLVGFEGISPTREGEPRTPRGEFPPVLY